MNCKEVREILISSFLDGENQKEKIKEIETHLNVCRDCLDVSKKAKWLRMYGDEFRKITPPDKVRENIRNEVLKEKKVIRPIFLRFPLLKFALPAVMIFIITIILVLRNYKGKYEDSLTEFVGNQAEFIISLEMGDTTLYEPLSQEEN